MNKRSLALRGYSMILASALCFGSYGVWSRFLGHDFDIFSQGWLRSAIILVILLPVMVLTRNHKSIFGKGSRWFWVTMIFTVFTQAPIYFAFNNMAIGTATLIFHAMFLVTSYIVGWLFLSERLTPVKIISLGVALVGLLVTFGLSLVIFSVGAMLLAALNGVASGGEVATSKATTRTYSSLQVTTYSWIFILMTHLPLALVTGERNIVPALATNWWAILGYALSGLLGFWLVIEGFKYVDASIGGLIGLFEIIFSVVFGIFLFKDQLTTSTILGGGLIVAAIVLPDMYALLHSKIEKPAPVPKHL